MTAAQRRRQRKGAGPFDAAVAGSAAVPAPTRDGDGGHGSAPPPTAPDASRRVGVEAALPLARLGRLLRAIEQGDDAALTEVHGARARRPDARVIVIAGPAGAGKSTLLGQLIRAERRGGRRVGVLAVDPSSPRTGGALLGDRLRLGDALEDEGICVRSLAQRGAPGGLSAAIDASIEAMVALGCDVVYVESVGIGQAELDAALLADVFVLVLAPQAGDLIQAMKAGVVELADVLVVHKADLAESGRLAVELEAAIALGRDRAKAPPIVRVASARGEGIAALQAAIAAVAERRLSAGERRALLLRRAVELGLRQRVTAFFASADGQSLALQVSSGALDPTVAGALALAALCPSNLEQ